MLKQPHGFLIKKKYAVRCFLKKKLISYLIALENKINEAIKLRADAIFLKRINEYLLAAQMMILC